MDPWVEFSPKFLPINAISLVEDVIMILGILFLFFFATLVDS